MNKKIMLLLITVLLVLGCQSNEVKENTNPLLEEELQLVKQQLETKETEIAHLKSALEQSKSQLDSHKQNYIMILKEEVPMVWGEADVQLWEYVRGFSNAGEKVWIGGTTNWRESVPDTNPNLTATSPSLILNAWLAWTESNYWLGIDFWETTLRVNYLDENTAEGFILYYGLGDDSIAGIEFKFLMKKENEFWYIETIEERERCLRDVSEDGGLCV